MVGFSYYFDVSLYVEEIHIQHEIGRSFLTLQVAEFLRQKIQINHSTESRIISRRKVLSKHAAVL